MSDIAPIGRPNAATLSPASVNGRSVETTPQQAGRGNDKVELSSTARYLAKLAEVPDVREDLVNSVRGQLAKGTYESPEKLDTAVERLIDDLA